MSSIVRHWSFPVALSYDTLNGDIFGITGNADVVVMIGIVVGKSIVSVVGANDVVEGASLAWDVVSNTVVEANSSCSKVVSNTVDVSGVVDNAATDVVSNVVEVSLVLNVLPNSDVASIDVDVVSINCVVASINSEVVSIVFVFFFFFVFVGGSNVDESASTVSEVVSNTVEVSTAVEVSSRPSEVVSKAVEVSAVVEIASLPPGVVSYAVDISSRDVVSNWLSIFVVGATVGDVVSKGSVVDSVAFVFFIFFVILTAAEVVWSISFVNWIEKVGTTEVAGSVGSTVVSVAKFPGINWFFLEDFLVAGIASNWIGGIVVEVTGTFSGSSLIGYSKDTGIFVLAFVGFVDMNNESPKMYISMKALI